MHCACVCDRWDPLRLTASGLAHAPERERGRQQREQHGLHAVAVWPTRQKGIGAERGREGDGVDGVTTPEDRGGARSSPESSMLAAPRPKERGEGEDDAQEVRLHP